MNQTEKDEDKMEPGPSPDETSIAYALVIRTSIERIPEVKKALLAVPGVQLIYQKASVDRLEIVERPRVRRSKEASR